MWKSHAALKIIFIILAIPNEKEKGYFVRIVEFRMTFLWGEVKLFEHLSRVFWEKLGSLVTF